MLANKFGEWIFLNLGTGAGAVLGFIQNDPVFQVLSWCGLGTLMFYNFYRAMNERQKYLDSKTKK